MKQYVDGREQLSGSVVYLPIDTAARISIGVRQDPRYWFKGTIRMIKFSKRALTPSEFTFPVVTGIKKTKLSSPESRMLQNFPNPCNPGTTIQFFLQKPDYVRIDLVDMLGRYVATLSDRLYEKGTHAIFWNGTNKIGHPLSTGVYVCRLQTERHFLTQKIVLIR